MGLSPERATGKKQQKTELCVLAPQLPLRKRRGEAGFRNIELIIQRFLREGLNNAMVSLTAKNGPKTAYAPWRIAVFARRIGGKAANSRGRKKKTL